MHLPYCITRPTHYMHDNNETGKTGKPYHGNGNLLFPAQGPQGTWAPQYRYHGTGRSPHPAMVPRWR